MPTQRPDFTTSDVEGLMGRGNPGAGKPSFPRLDSTDNPDYTISPGTTDSNEGLYTSYQDKRNLTPMTNVDADGAINYGDKNGGIPRDMVRFNIKVIDPEKPNNAELLVFRAYLDDVSDSYSANYNSYKYNGRAEKFYTYNEFDRNVSFKFRIHAQSRAEMKPLYQKLNYLVAQTAPSYKNGRMRAKFSRLTIGDWCNELPGFFESVDLNWTGKYSFEVDSEEREGTVDGIRMNQLPHQLDVSCKFKPIHDFAPENSRYSPFILPHRGGIPDSQNWLRNDDPANR